ncbi:MAG: hypothetical protein H6635_00105 [Anaerolineales bacterium]|nr:hypothetical protein [Anaerolineales bacterium]
MIELFNNDLFFTLPGVFIGISLLVKFYKEIMTNIHYTEPKTPNYFKEVTIEQIQKVQPSQKQKENNARCEYCGTKSKTDDVHCKSCGAQLP